jgi:hydroxypyruvate reductase 2
LGNIGLLIAKRLEAFGCIINYSSRKQKDSMSYKYFSSVYDLASESDVLVVACALNKDTRHIVNKDVLEALGKDGIIINIGRGANVDEAELVSEGIRGGYASAKQNFPCKTGIAAVRDHGITTRRADAAEPSRCR